MSKLNISPNLFLEVNELRKLVQFLTDDGYKPFLKHLTKSFGIAQNENNTYFKVSRKNEAQNIVIVNAGIAFDHNLNRIYLEEDKELSIPNTGVNQWLIISYTSTNNEEGTVSISAQGALSGIGTKFTSVLRGQPNFPTKVKFNSKINTGEYEVVDVTSDTVATIVGSFSAEQNLKYQVIGTFTPGFQPNDEDKTIYEYDSCRIDIVESEDRPTLEEGQYIIAKVSYVGGVISVSDERIRNLFNYEVAIDDDVNTNTLQSNPFVALRQTTIRSERMLDVQFEWGYTVNKFELVTSADTNTFNIITGSSKYISSNRIPDGIFAGWLLVNRKNMVSVVIDDNKNNAIYINKLNPLMITGEGDDEFVIVPNVKDIEIEVTLNKIESNSASVASNQEITVNKSNTLIPNVSTADKVIQLVNPSLGLTNSQSHQLAASGAIQHFRPATSLDKIQNIWGEAFVIKDNLKYDLSNNLLIGTVDKNLITDEKLISLLDASDYGETKYFFKFSIENAASRFVFPVEYGQTLVQLRYRIISSVETTKFQNFANSQFKNINDNMETLGKSSFIIIVTKPEEVERNYS